MQENRARENHFDLLRIVCMLAVIVMHVSATYAAAMTDAAILGETYRANMVSTCLYNAVTRFAVPCFVMLSGAFILSDERNRDPLPFYRKSLRSIGIPTAVFSVLYLLFALLVAAADMVTGGAPAARLLLPFRDLLIGMPYYHIWFLYMLIGLYLLAPAVIRCKAWLGEARFAKCAWVFLLLAACSEWTSRHTLGWDVGQAFCYLGYFMIGYVLRQGGLAAKSNGKAAVLLLSGVAVGCVTAYVRYRQALAGISDAALTYSRIDPYSPLVVVSSLLLFAGFARLRGVRDCHRFAGLTFLIYLFHAGVWAVLNVVVQRVFGAGADSRIVIPVGSAIVLLFSTLLALLYQRIWRACNAKYRWEERLIALTRRGETKKA